MSASATGRSTPAIRGDTGARGALTDRCGSRAASRASVPQTRPRRCRRRRRRSPYRTPLDVERAPKRDALVRAVLRQQIDSRRAADDPDVGQRPNDRQDEAQRASVIGGGSIVHGQRVRLVLDDDARLLRRVARSAGGPIGGPGNGVATCRPTTRARDSRTPAARRCPPLVRKCRRAHGLRSRRADSASRRERAAAAWLPAAAHAPASEQSATACHRSRTRGERGFAQTSEVSEA